MTRLPNPPKVMLNGLDEGQKVKVIRLALQMVYELGRGNDYCAFEMFEMAGLSIEERIAVGSMLDSKQGAIIASLGEASARR